MTANPGVSLTQAVCCRLHLAAVRAGQSETGGILLGWREDDHVIVSDLIELPMARPRRSMFILDAGAASAALKQRVAMLDDARVGYVGSWHSHPEEVPPSERDFATYRAAAAASPGAVGFVVVAKSEEGSALFVNWAVQLDGIVEVVEQRRIDYKGDFRGREQND